mmetsp:Transcript_79691/g.251907  ORF Transcript_79691/g.251907 Transcript_79691/m.251907 type:complete len:200 (-) Transcript_79691:19-618(-)
MHGVGAGGPVQQQSAGLRRDVSGPVLAPYPDAAAAPQEQDGREHAVAFPVLVPRFEDLVPVERQLHRALVRRTRVATGHAVVPELGGPQPPLGLASSHTLQERQELIQCSGEGRERRRQRVPLAAQPGPLQRAPAAGRAQAARLLLGRCCARGPVEALGEPAPQGMAVGEPALEEALRDAAKEATCLRLSGEKGLGGPL